MYGPATTKRARGLHATGAPLKQIYRACLTLGLLMLASWAAGSPLPAGATASPPPPTLAVTGKVVKAQLSGFEPDFDPIDRIIISSTLHDGRPAPRALPDAMLVLSLYLENFQPDTTPNLPDLLHPDQQASSLGGFMQGKAALVNRGGRDSFRGSVLAEVFLDNSVHMVLDVQPPGPTSTARPLRLKGIITLHKNLTIDGSFGFDRPLSPSEAQALRVPPGRLPSWQAVVQHLSVQPPRMMGTPRKTRTTPATARAPQQQTIPVQWLAPALGGVAVALIAALAIWRRPLLTLGRRRPALSVTPPGNQDDRLEG